MNFQLSEYQTIVARLRENGIEGIQYKGYSLKVLSTVVDGFCQEPYAVELTNKENGCRKLIENIDFEDIELIDRDAYVDEEICNLEDLGYLMLEGIKRYEEELRGRTEQTA